MSFFGADPSAIIGHIGGAIGSLAPAPAPRASFAPGQGPGSGGFAPAPMVAGSNAWPTVTIGGGGFQPAQMQGGSFRPSGGLAGGFQPSGGIGGGFQPSGGIGGSPFQPAAQNPLLAPKAPASTGTTTPGGGGANYAGPTSAADNAGLTGQQIDRYIAQARPGSPLAGMGQFILAEANRQGVSVPQLIGIMTLESGLGTEQGTLPGVFNYGGLTGTGWAGQTGNTTGMARAFATFGSKEAGIAALISNLASPLYKGKTLQQQIATWYLGNPDAPLNSSDENQNATLQQYLDVINGAYQGLGVGARPQGGGSLVQRAESLVGTPYSLGGLRGHPDQPQLGLDCSEYTAWVYQGQGVNLPWNAQGQYNQTQRVDPQNLQVGDLVFFHGTNAADPDYITHVGMYIGNGRMINAQDGGVMEADLNSQYWQQHYAGAGRVQGVQFGAR